jgi:hypothetical protein
MWFLKRAAFGRSNRRRVLPMIKMPRGVTNSRGEGAAGNLVRSETAIPSCDVFAMVSISLSKGW